MNAVVRPAEATFEPLTERWLDDVLAIELAAYEFPWSRGNFADSLRAGYQAQVLVAGGRMLGYFIAMKGVDEAHLLNITVAPECRGEGWGRVMMEALAIWARGQGAQWLWLEVRESNRRARHVYEVGGFQSVGQRKGYYSAAGGAREDAVVMSLKL
jgi:ribosomal-protein-alanine N-acetyltransferase